ncbi:Zinc finger domain-containing protein, C2H2-type [Cordyceps fumosorosea ARSEF 2679]|uniref:Zinc finger domain-containing protein, C2H2-type n=1 Tax=Cordyceps fumosorosea (strain ARSEF 2679) TaxID=1081104 RepID=A0A162LPY9_CORFA|nr:Zinc finger domain-containing protein, C2H2-type [Cordyceps fumosorosea ARSEF 2679]OAA73934.1 Zinc finger domain-containing protein, C2H2-type [Cordyceps fumosorosea ARSEF 2679]
MAQPKGDTAIVETVGAPASLAFRCPFVIADTPYAREELSVTNQTHNVAALTAAIADSDPATAIPIANGSARRNTISKAARMSIAASLPSPPASLPLHRSLAGAKMHQDSAIDDDSMSGEEVEGSVDGNRARRASDGQSLTKDSKKSNRVEVRCETCGKSYKHSSCLTKHLWEHTPEWSLTSKLLISKHQQVQLLEAASVLVAMNGPNQEPEVVTPPDSARDFTSEPESASPTASGYSEHQERHSSADTTPPPVGEHLGFNGLAYREKRLSGGSGIAQSLRSPPLYPEHLSSSVPHAQWNTGRRPSLGPAGTGNEDRDLAAAVELLSCSFGSNGGHDVVGVAADAPPVPPVPEQYRDQARSFSTAGFLNSFPARQPESFTRGEFRRGSHDVKMEDSGESAADEDDLESRARARSDEDDDGVFGRMEE